MVSAVRRRAHGVRSLHPRAICRSQSPPVRATRLEHLRVGLVSRGLVGAIGWSSVSSPVRWGCRSGRTPRASLPYISTLAPRPRGGLGPTGAAGLCAGASGRAPQVSYLVDSASSHMLVSKIKPCMSKYKQLVL